VKYVPGLRWILDARFQAGVVDRHHVGADPDPPTFHFIGSRSGSGLYLKLYTFLENNNFTFNFIHSSAS
jgi:hypothetical protein